MRLPFKHVGSGARHHDLDCTLFVIVAVPFGMELGDLVIQVNADAAAHAHNHGLACHCVLPVLEMLDQVFGDQPDPLRRSYHRLHSSPFAFELVLCGRILFFGNFLEFGIDLWPFVRVQFKLGKSAFVVNADGCPIFNRSLDIVDIDIFSAAGLKAPDISILSDEFLAEVKGLPQRNLAFEVLKKLLNDEIKVRSRKNLVQSRLFSQMLEESIRKYQNRSIETAQVIQELIDLAKQMREANKRGEDLGFSDEELAFYDALEVNDSAVKVLGDETLKTIARELVDTVRKNTTIDWTVKESVKAKLRTMVKRILRKYGYPPDKQEKATLTVLEQAELLCKEWAA
jgi:hypothetical protein